MNKKLVLVACFLVVPAVASRSHAQGPPRHERFLREIRSALDEPFRGVTAEGQVEPDLFAIRATGVTTEPVRTAADAFLASLSEEQRKRTEFAVDDPEWRKWDNRHFYVRQGVGFDEMTDRQRDLAFSLLRSSLSAKGLKKTRDIMRLNGTLAELTNNFQEYGQWLYWITIMGKPSPTQPWGWQLDGHHVVINYFVLGDQVVMTPVFMGSEPVEARTGRFKGTVVMQDEQDKGLKLFSSLDETQRGKAIIRSGKGPTDTLAEAFRDNIALDYAGICASEFSKEQTALLADLIQEYVGNMDEGHARVKMDEVRRHFDRTYFAWVGTTAPDGVFYYRVHSPVILIEFDHQRPIALERSRVPTRNHVHTVVRTPNGNDYGKDLLRQHYKRHVHGEHGHEHEQ